jgi:hypothetical protein
MGAAPEDKLPQSSLMINRQNYGVDPTQIEVYRVLRERFAPLARYSGPLFAGIHVHQGIAGGFYIDQQKQWLWLPDTAGCQRPEDAILSDEAVARQAELRTVVENLLRNSRLIFELYLEHLERIKDRPTFVADLGVYLTDEIALVVDAIALRGRHGN